MDDSRYTSDNDLTDEYGISPCQSGGESSAPDSGGLVARPVGGIEFDRDCEETHASEALPWWVELGSGVTDASAKAHLNGHGPAEAYSWVCSCTALRRSVTTTPTR